MRGIMEIKVDYLESDVIASGDSYRKKTNNVKKGDAIMISIFPGNDGIDYCYIVLTDTGEIKKVSTDLIKVVDTSFVSKNK